MANEFKIKTGLLLGAPTTQPVTSIKDTSTSITADASSLLVTGKAIYDFHTANSAGSSYWELDGSTLVLTDESVDVKLSSIEIGADAGVVTLIEMDVSVSAVEESYAFNIDGTTIAKVYAEGDGTGGILEPAFKVVESFIAESSVYMSGITEVSTGYTLYYNPTSHVVTYAEASLGGGGTGSGTGDVAWADGSVGSNNQILTAVGDGSIYAESTLTWDGCTLIPTAISGGSPFIIQGGLNTVGNEEGTLSIKGAFRPGEDGGSITLPGVNDIDGGPITIAGGFGGIGGGVGITGGAGGTKNPGGDVSIAAGASGGDDAGSIYIGLEDTEQIFIGNETTIPAGTPDVSEYLFIDVDAGNQLKRTSVILGNLGDVSISGVTDGSALVYYSAGSYWTYGTGGGGGTTDASLGSLTDVSINDASLYDIITPNADGNWVNQQKEWYTDSSLIQPVNSDYDVQLASIEIVEDAGAITIIDMPISSTPAVGTEESYAFNMSGNLVAKIWSEADGAGDASITGLVVETAQYMGDPNTNGSWRFYVTDDASADLVFEKLISGTWTQKGKFTE